MTDQDRINLNILRALEETYAVLSELYPFQDARVERLRVFIEAASEHYNKLVPTPEEP